MTIILSLLSSDGSVVNTILNGIGNIPEGECQKKQNGKTPKLLRLTNDTVRRLAAAAAKAGMSEAVYTEVALKEQFEKDGIG